ncbi:fumarylacetoacetate hydrolase family protein [Micromonospora sp. LOL_013]|uniref:fumarylacetoacetate hydrolase family protein n=1 Tax=Micromonospora sp. LOL_013 TaxID=3345414 RepID=UPI003A83A4B4
MRFACVRGADGPAWGIVRDDNLHYIDTDPYREYRETGEVVAVAAAQLLAPVTPSKLLCLGKNYEAHRAEMGFTNEGVPSIFMKPPTTLVGPGDAVVLPPRTMSTHVEHEAELAVVIGRAARFVSEADALDHVLGYTCANDVSARDLQRADPHPTRGKGFDTFCPIGPWIGTDIDIDTGVDVRCRVNGDLRQEGSTTQMTFGVRFLVSYISQFTTLLPGDVLLTGSPGGTGALVPGDEVEIEVGGVGVLRHHVVASPRP